MRRTIMVTAALAVVTFVTVGPGIAGSPDPVVNASPPAKEKVLKVDTASIRAIELAPDIAALNNAPVNDVPDCTVPSRPIAVAGPDIEPTASSQEHGAIVAAALRTADYNYRDHPAFLGVTVTGVAAGYRMIIDADVAKVYTRAGPPLALVANGFAQVGLAHAAAHLLC